MKVLIMITGDLLLAAIVFYGVIKAIGYFSRNPRNISKRQAVFPKMAAPGKKQKDEQIAKIDALAEGLQRPK